MRAIAKVFALILAFGIASGATYVAIHRWKPAVPRPNAVQVTGHQDTLDGVSGLTSGEVVVLPQLSTLGGETINLGSSGSERLLCVFISTHCPGCTRDAVLWQELHKEAATRDTAFYLIDVNDERDEVDRFVIAYNLQQLSILYDPTHKVGPQLKVGFVPQYILFNRNGEVVHRWDGIRHYDKNGGAEQLAEFFQPH